MVPKGWSSWILSDICRKQISYGIVQTGDNLPNGIPCLRVVDLTRDVMRLEDMIKTSEETNKAYRKTILEKDEIVMALRGEIGLARLIDDNLVGANITRGLARISPETKVVLPEFLLWELRSPQFRADLIRRVGGSALQEISLTELRKVRTLLPPLLEQKKIAQILSTWDKAISVTEKLLANSQRQKKALMQQLLTGNKRLLDENGVRFNGKWEKKLLSDVADVYQPKTISQSMMSDSGYPVYGANGVIGFYQEFNHETEQIAVTCRGSTCGIVNWTQAKSWITGNAMVINTDNYSYVSKKFLFYTLNGSDLKYLISGSGQPQITGNIKTHIINLPCIEEQQKIATVLSAADAEIYTLEKKLACLRDEKKALMQQLLTGKRRVKMDEAVAA
ncbi:TPA: restriction endonuclease subunit S [Escherichia coli]|uniref:restriction endonuclease subunit S n=1 Tax=Escherichia coli TaxID=562 RepID=UPI002150DA8E|nr:restriction endonuclease subunit S [Escherichia coli]ELT0220855.1 restriction endonuclease subunit S [Escherichia coli]MCR6144668.1 restriction endonuclease subunit S [Escherichia coli]MCU6248401.1 restriction endonuclease subunit S [Escherichia coli]MCU6294189.1 restriction endonuclease subunit S [Escherichia coli]MCU6373202.1 restriction endonuclease subunit S [Escherichia coli]